MQPQLTSTYKFLAIDQYGNHVMIKEHPRKELLEHHGIKYASKTYIDANKGHTYHVGYAIQGSWYDIYTIEPWKPEPIQ